MTVAVSELRIDAGCAGLPELVEKPSAASLTSSQRATSSASSCSQRPTAVSFSRALRIGP